MFLFNFLFWHYIRASKFILKAWFNFIAFAFHLFSVRFLLKTLFSPWRRVEIVSQTSGFSLERFFHQLTFNLISRSIGFLVRTILIIFGLLLAIFIFILGLFVLIGWQLVPFASWPLFLLTRPKIKTDQDSLKGEAKEFVFQRLGVKTEAELKKFSSEDIQATLKWYLEIKAIKDKKARFWEKENLFKLPSIGSDLAFGYTPQLDKYCQDLSFPPSFSHQLVGRKKEIKQIEAVLLRAAQNNVLLIGEPGVGKHTILLGLAKAIKEKKVNPALFFKRILLLDMNLILGKSPLTTEVKAKFQDLLKEAQAAGNIILAIDQIEKYISPQLIIDLTPVLIQMAKNTKIQIIGVTTPDNFERFIFPNEQIIKYFEKVEVYPPSKAEALEILEKILPDFEKGKEVITTFQALKEIIDQSDKLITHIPFPEKAIDLLDQLITEAHSLGKKVITEKDVDDLISQKVKIPVGSLSKDEAAKLKNLDTILHQRIVNQKEAVKALTMAMQRARLELGESEKPIGTFLFLGPTGVGKTETAKALAEAYFGSEKQMTRFDMSQPFKLELLIKEARERPFGILLLDEFEKASREVLNLFLTVFDEGYIKDTRGKIVSFKNMIIICTSNAGAEFIRGMIKNQPKISTEQFQAQIIEYVLQQHIFSPEMVNRFDGVIVFKPLEKNHVEQIAKMMVDKLAKRLFKKGIVLTSEPQVYQLLALQGHSFQFGARPMKRLIAQRIESLIAQMILDNEIKKGDKIKLTVDFKGKDFKIERNA